MEKKVIRLTENQLRGLIKESVNSILNESFGHWKSQKLASIIKQHGRGKYGDNLSTNWFLTSLTDENIEGVSKEPINDNHFGKYCFPLGDGTYLIYNIKDNKIAQSYHGDWAGRFSDSAVKAVRPHNGFARARDFNHIDSDYYSRQHFKPTTRRGEDARDLRNNPYFKEGRKQDYNRDGGWNKKSAAEAMNNLRNGKDKNGNDNRTI